MKGGSKVVIEQHRHAGVFIARGKEDALVTFNMAPGIRWDDVVDRLCPQLLQLPNKGDLAN